MDFLKEKLQEASPGWKEIFYDSSDMLFFADSDALRPPRGSKREKCCVLYSKTSLAITSVLCFPCCISVQIRFGDDTEADTFVDPYLESCSQIRDRYISRDKCLVKVCDGVMMCPLCVPLCSIAIVECLCLMSWKLPEVCRFGYRKCCLRVPEGLDASKRNLFRYLSKYGPVKVEATELGDVQFRFESLSKKQVVLISDGINLPRLHLTSGGLFLKTLRGETQLDIELLNGHLAILHPANLERLKKILVKGDVYIVGAESLREIEDCQVDGSLCIRDASSLRYLPSDLQVKGGIDIAYAGIETFPDGIQSVNGDLRLKDCPELLMLGRGLRIVKGNLDLSNCFNLIDLAPWTSQHPTERLVVFGDLKLTGCLLLQSLPDQLVVMGSKITLKGCGRLRTIPESVLASLENREVIFFITGSGITLATAISIRSQYPNVDFGYHVDEGYIRLSTSPEAFHLVVGSSDAIRSAGEQSFSNEDLSLGDLVFEQVKEEPFTSLAEVASYFGKPSLLLDQFVENAYKDPFLSFLNRIRESKEFAQSRQSIIWRVGEVLELICTDPLSSQALLLYMCDAADSCEDKPLWALNQMTLICKIEHAKGDLSKMRTLGLGVMRLGIVHEHARRFLQASSEDLDEIGVYLQLEVQLRKKLNLPVSSHAMVHPVQLPEVLVQQIIEAATAVDDESFQFEQWLREWEEWQREMRRTFYEAWPYEKLNGSTREMNIEGETNLFGEPLEDPVLFNGLLYSYSELMTHWVETGMDFYNVTWRDSDILLAKLIKIIPGGKDSEACDKVRVRPDSFPSLKDDKRSSLRKSLPALQLMKRRSATATSPKRSSTCSSKSSSLLLSNTQGPSPQDMSR